MVTMNAIRSDLMATTARKGFTRMYDLKTISGKASVSNRLAESVGQTNRVILNMIIIALES